MEQDGSGLPRFVVAEFERSLRCGILAHGFARVRSIACGDELLVAFSCNRGICPSCTTRRMQGTATTGSGYARAGWEFAAPSGRGHLRAALRQRAQPERSFLLRGS